MFFQVKGTFLCNNCKRGDRWRTLTQRLIISPRCLIILWLVQRSQVPRRTWEVEAVNISLIWVFYWLTLYHIIMMFLGSSICLICLPFCFCYYIKDYSTKPWFYGFNYKVNLGLLGLWQDLKNGSRGAKSRRRFVKPLVENTGFFFN